MDAGRFIKRKIIFTICLITILLGCTLLFSSESEVIERKVYNLKSELQQPEKIILDSNEFAPDMNAVEQIKNAPSPRYKTGHKLLPNILWMSPRYFGGTGQPGVTQKQIIDRSSAIMLSLAQRMNYYLVLPGSSYGLTGYNDPSTLPGAYIKLANDHPELPASVITFWSGIKPNLCGYKKKDPAILRSDFPENFYIKAGKRMRLSPSSPDDSLVMDGETFRCYYETLCKNLTRPIQLINENGEVFKLFGKSILQKDSLSIIDKEKRGIKDWDIYEATRRLEKEKLVQKQYLNMDCLKNTIYTEYGIDGHKTYRHRYEQVRQINSKINGQYYSTPDFYPRWPSNWKYWKGAWHGFKWIADCRNVEISLGDHLYSPFVSAGWDNDEGKNIRPAQWLGLLKVLGVTGAEFYYTGFFSLKAPFPKPENYAWQSVMPAYSQAITSYYEDILRNGELLNPPNYNLSKTEDELIVARKSKDKNVYVVSGTIQPTSNHRGSSPLDRKTTFNIAGKEVSIMIRRQGSTYILDFTKTAPVIIQLDTWHEYKHPNKWNTSLLKYEAEVTDNIIDVNSIATEGINGSDFSQHLTFIKLNEKNLLIYNPEFTQKNESVYCWIKARGKDGKIQADRDGHMQEIKVKSGEWEWLKLAEYKEFTKDKIAINGQNADLDKVYFTTLDTPPSE